MSDERTPYSPPDAAPPPRNGRPSDRNPRGSLGLGIGLFFACLVGGAIAGMLLRDVMIAVVGMSRSGWLSLQTLYVVPMLVPWVAALVLGIWLALRGRTRTALGMLVGFGLLGALILLLAAACFGLFYAGGGLGPFH